MKYKIFLLFFFCFCSLQGFSQGSNNPFDIQGRTPDQSILQDSSVQQSLNVFDRNGGAEETTASNPFDVSHIPQKKSEIDTPKRAKKRQNQPSSFFDFLFWVMLSLSAFFAALMFLFRNQIMSLTRPLLNQNYLNMLKRETDGGQNAFFLSMYLFFFVNLGILIYNAFQTYTDYKGWQILFYCILGSMLVYLGKHMYLGIISYVFPIDKPISSYSFTVILYNAILGLILFPLNLLIVLGPENIRNILLIGAFVILAIFFVIRLIQGFLNSSRIASGNIFHFFLYLCTSEIAPLALIFGFI